jgi:hypothetical protein
MLWEGFKRRGMKARLAQGLEGTLDAEGATVGDLPLSAQSTGGPCSSTHAQEVDADQDGATVGGADSGPQGREGQGAKEAGVRPMLVEKPGGASVLEEVEALDTSQWEEDWSWKDKLEFKPAGGQPQGWRWVLACLRALAIEERGPWLRTLTWQDRIIGCVQQVCPEYQWEKRYHDNLFQGQGAVV